MYNTYLRIYEGKHYKLSCKKVARENLGKTFEKTPGKEFGFKQSCRI